MSDANKNEYSLKAQEFYLTWAAVSHDIPASAYSHLDFIELPSKPIWTFLQQMNLNLNLNFIFIHSDTYVAWDMSVTVKN